MPHLEHDQPNSYALPRENSKVIKPLSKTDDDNTAVNLIRQKIGQLYQTEPDAETEIEEAEAVPRPQRSKHQQYMHGLSQSGRSLEDIQTAWHSYYSDLPDNEKREVWQEFYSEHKKQTAQQAEPSQVNATERHPIRIPYDTHVQSKNYVPQPEQVPDIKQKLLEKIAGQSQSKQANVKSAVFGLSMGAIVLLVMGFGFFNQRFIAPFITPSTVLSSTPLIVDGNAAVGEDPKIIIPKINVDIPTVYDEESINEATVQRALEDGILHYPTTPEPGQVGNSVFFGHSSNNILNRGKYKFAFVLLNRLEPGDTFMLEKNGTRYVYRVYDKKVVPPTDLSVLDPDPDRESIATLITCDPPGTSINRLAVFGEQISPSPADNTENTLPPPNVNPQPEVLPSNAPSLWQRITGS
ncbi:hypothetical protein BH23PAT2_BH23PAT2_09840 [soil metagenome]